MLTEDLIKGNWNKFSENINAYISSPRKEVLLAFYDKYANRVALMPASTKDSYHNAFIGGYCDHVNRVVECSFKVKHIWSEMGAIIDFTDEELAMVAINHDLGKFGSEEHEMYIDQDSEWHKKNRGEKFKSNPLLSFMKIQDRSLFILQSLGINLTENEYLGIKLHDGLYEEGNKGYYVAFSEEYKLRSNLPYIIHQGDLMAARIEGDLLKKPTKPDIGRIIPDVPKNDRQPLNEGVSVKPKSSNKLLKKFLSV